MLDNVRHNLQLRAKKMREQMNAEERCLLAEDIAQVIEEDDLSSKERALAEDIIASLISDEMEIVRRAIAAAVQNSPHLPTYLAQSLARDIAEISLPVLKLSPVLEERFLQEVVKTGVVEKMAAVAQRRRVSANICRLIVASGRKEPVEKLLQNPGAEITDHTMVTIIRVYGDDELIEQAVFGRDLLSEDVLVTLRELSEAHVSTFILRYFDLRGHEIDLEDGRNLLQRPNPQVEEAPTNWWHSEQGPI